MVHIKKFLGCCEVEAAVICVTWLQILGISLWIFFCIGTAVYFETVGCETIVEQFPECVELNKGKILRRF